MSSLYKQYFVINQAKGARVINSDELVEKKLAELKKNMDLSKTQPPDEEGFSLGIGAPVVEVEQEPEVDHVALAKEEAEKLLADAKAQSDTMIQEAEDHVQELQAAAKEEGYAAGYAEGTGKAREEQTAWLTEHETQQNIQRQQYEEKLRDMEPQLLDVILHVIEKVFHIQFSDKKEILLYLIGRAIDGTEGSQNFIIRAGKENYPYLHSHKEELAACVRADATLDVIADNLIEEDACMIETDGGIFDCTLSAELGNLMKDLRSLSS